MRGRLSILYFLQFAVWGCYLTSLGQFLGAGGLGKEIAWFYAAIGIVSLLTPALMGRLADRYIRPAALLGLCHFLAGCSMICAWIYASSHTTLEFGPFYVLYIVFLAFYMPTMALANTTSFGIIHCEGRKPVDIFPSIRVWGTVGFIAAMWMVNSTYFHNGTLGWTLDESNPFAPYRFQYNSMQLICSGLAGIVCSIYSLSLPYVPLRSEDKNEGRIFKVFNFRVLKEFFVVPKRNLKSDNAISKTGIFLIFVALIGVCMQISNGFATPFISHFMGEPEYRFDSFASGNATMLFSLSQIAEALFVLCVGKSLKKWGIGVVFGIGMLAWTFRFFFFAVGDPGDGLIFLILSMMMYGIAFNFITIAGHLHIESVSPDGSKGLGQGVMMLMGNGIGATVGVVGAGAIINRWCHWEIVSGPNGSTMRLFMGEWQYPWLLFSAFTFLLLLAGILFYKVRPSRRPHKLSRLSVLDSAD